MDKDTGRSASSTCSTGRNEVDNSLDWCWAVVYGIVPGATEDLVIAWAHLDFFYAIMVYLKSHTSPTVGTEEDLNDI
jgi:hypothetical protein